MAEDSPLIAGKVRVLADGQGAAVSRQVDRARGALLELAVGDALGTTLEFSQRDLYPHHTEMTGGGPFRLEPGQWTDDTSMALALADSLIAHPELDAHDLMNRFVAWWREGTYSCTGACFDIGLTTREALARYLKTGAPFAGSNDPRAAGNGSLMRLAPAAIHALHNPKMAQHFAIEQSRTTHAAPQAVEACAVFAEFLVGAMQGVPKEELLQPRTWHGDQAIAVVAAGGWRGRPRATVRSSGYVVHTLEAALWAVDQTASFDEALVLAVNLGDDADSVGAVTGQLAGALYGMSAIPERWLAPLAWRERLVGAADALLTTEEPR
jgi:ADP-ribosyl-[dinitrogen reductase] hydrolase